MATQTQENSDALYLSYISFPLLSNDEADDCMWGSFDPVLLKEDSLSRDKARFQKDIFPVESDNQIILQDTKHWVDKGDCFLQSLFISIIFISFVQ